VDWRACRTDIDPDSLKGQWCFVGLDLASVRDIAAMTFIFPGEDASYTVWPHLFMPQSRIEEKGRHDGVPYRRWKQEGHLSTTPGKTLDYAFIRQRLIDLREEGYKVQAVGYDPWSAEETAHVLSGEGFDMVEVRQGYRSMSEPSKAFERLVIEHKIRHGGNPAMDWMVSNLMWMSDPKGNRYPTRENEHSKIDGPVAGIIALAVALVADPPKVSDPTKGLNFA
jgi:phage terminase large subunit-like protein